MQNKVLNELKKNKGTDAHQEPVFFNLKKIKDQNTLGKLFKTKKILCVSDDFFEQLKELYAIQHPSEVYQPYFEENFTKHCNKIDKTGSFKEEGVWVYFPWNGNLVHILKEKDFMSVRTARNRYLINEKEQDVFYNSVIGIAGLSVGNSVILSIILQGGGKHIRIADFDRLALTNTNRVRTSITALGMLKAEMTARQIYEINPFTKIEIFSDGITQKNIEKFMNGSRKLDIVIDEIDNIAVKYLIREKAKEHKVPLVMGADDGDNAVVDIERYDLEPSLPFFHGRLGNVTYEKLKNLDKFGIGKTITQHIGPENITERMQQSLLEMGKTIVSWPQLGGAALLNGSAVAYCVRRILNGEPIESNRAIISLDEKLIPNYNSKTEKQKRNQIAKTFKKMFGL
jgi:hypothetical protein